METTNQVEAGKHYWIMLNQYHEWQAGYVFQDHDRNLWLQLMGVEKPLEVIKLTQLIAVEINPPERITKPIPTKGMALASKEEAIPSKQEAIDTV